MDPMDLIEDLPAQLRVRCENYQGIVRTHYCGKCVPCLAANEIELNRQLLKNMMGEA